MDYANRAEREAKLARALGRLSAQQRTRLLELLGDPPKLDNITPEDWGQIHREFSGVLIPELEAIFVDSAMELVGSMPQIGVEWGAINQTAADWARGYWSTGGGTTQWQYPVALAVQFTESRKRELSEIIPRFFEEGWNIGQLRERLDRLFGAGWGEMVAITETTRAAVQGERAVAAEVAKYGIKMVEVWQTERDELVCPICGPRHGKPKGDGWTEQDGPPAHPRCRCWTNHELVKPE